MAIHVYYTQLNNNKLTFFTDNIEDFKVLEHLLLFTERLGKMHDEDVVSLTVIGCLPLENQITISSNFLFPKVPDCPPELDSSVIGLLKNNGYLLTALPKEKTKSLWESLTSFVNSRSIRSLFFSYADQSPDPNTNETSSLIELNKTETLGTKLTEKYTPPARVVKKINKHV